MSKVIAFYIRLSTEDEETRNGVQSESHSISNQRMILLEFWKKMPELADYRQEEFFDDGYTGRNFDRPGFQKMIEKCRKGEIDCIIVKDFSRMGRNYVEVGNLIEQVFPFLGVRVISVNDGYDSAMLNGVTGGMDIAFKNLIYNLYSKDLSQKVKSAVRTRMKKGEYLAPYPFFGYVKSKEDIHKLKIDPEAAAIIRRIFQMVIGNIPRNKIAGQLNRESILTPAVYKQAKGCNRDWFPNGKKAGWTSTAVAKIIRDERYAGHMVSGKKRYEAFDSKHQIEIPKEEWIIVRNTHPAIVTDEEFAQANANMRSTSQPKRKNPSTKNNFSVIICPYCGLRLHYGNKKSDDMYCLSGRSNVHTSCGKVRINAELAENTLVQLVRNQAQLMVTATELLEKKTVKESKSGSLEERSKSVLLEKKKLERMKVEQYENYRDGNIKRDDFVSCKKQMDSNVQELEDLLTEIQRELESKQIDNMLEEVSEITPYADLQTYDKSVMAFLIEKAVVVDEKTLKVTWKHEDIYNEIFSKLG